MRRRLLLWLSVGAACGALALAAACVDNVTPDCSGAKGDCFPTYDSGPVGEGGSDAATDAPPGDASADAAGDASGDGAADAATDAATD